MPCLLRDVCRLVETPERLGEPPDRPERMASVLRTDEPTMEA